MCLDGRGGEGSEGKGSGGLIHPVCIFLRGRGKRV